MDTGNSLTHGMLFSLTAEMLISGGSRRLADNILTPLIGSEHSVTRTVKKFSEAHVAQNISGFLLSTSSFVAVEGIPGLNFIPSNSPSLHDIPLGLCTIALYHGMRAFSDYRIHQKEKALETTSPTEGSPS